MSRAAERLPLVLLPLLLPLSAAAQTTELASVGPGGVPGDGFSSLSAISADGRFVLFTSQSANLHPGDTDAVQDVFVRDLAAGVTELASVDSNGVKAAGTCEGNAISADGRWISFHSQAANLMPGDTGNDNDVFVRDRLSGTTTAVSLSPGGVEGDGDSETSVLSPDGSVIAFRSSASNLVANDTNGEWDVFVRDLASGVTERANLGPGGAQAHGDSYVTSLSHDGRFVLFSSLAADLVPGDTNLERDIFVRDRLAGTTTRVSVDSQGAQSNGDSHAGYLSWDGRFATFVSLATNLVPGDSNGAQDVFVHELATGETSRASVSSGGVQGNLWSTGSGISPDGRFVAIKSDASDLVAGDVNGTRDLFLRDRLLGRTTRVGLGHDGAAPTADVYAWGGALSANARRVAFFTPAPGLVPGYPGGTFQVYVRDRGPGSAFASLCASSGACPCGNAGLAGRGCENSSGTGGALLAASGEASLAADSVLFASSGELATALSILLQGDALVAPLAFGDGLRCAGGELKRLYALPASGGSITAPPSGASAVSVRSAELGAPIPIGATRVYQVYYRDPVEGFCPAPQGGTFNATNAIAIAWGA